MIKLIKDKNLYHSTQFNWLHSRFHFSFAEYYNPNNINFGCLRVINDDIIQANSGFNSHPHKNMEIITYVIDGTITHKDSIGTEQQLGSGNIQYMSAGTGILHSEHNKHDKPMRLLQIWISPNKKNLTPQYGQQKFNKENKLNNFLHMVSNIDGGAPIKINQDINIYASILDKNITFKVQKNRQVYLIVIDGDININNNHNAITHDGLTSIEEDINILPNIKSHLLILEMKKE